MQRESLSRRSCCSAVFLSLIAQLSENRCVLGVQAGIPEHRGTQCAAEEQTFGDVFPKQCR